ncbi:hypothetical protein FVEN_g86 [Fusarium venenatum]|uniref:Zn(2)-C6 fungal-type domain-containing protein n=2 Tax=Fusarium venenatum TaxID=56646 RepID=A0A2L2TG39_9HYPO|nr:uncharacterized protein FVRRES_07823 [Fusarium venenatum]KAG8361907.1 hypothetical protein FVEN_g86 [Fusarium venenatum]CEI63387.1 unnamed protein product [Fusarium venenatum]
MDTEDSPDSRPKESSKRRRLNFACNYCRNRKTRCDEQQPSCQACISAGIPCVTEDRRRPGKLIKRREAGKSIDGSSVGSGSPSEYGIHSVTENVLNRRPSIAKEQLTTRTISVATGPIRARSQSPRQSLSRGSSHTDTISNPLPILKQSTGTTSFQVLTEWLDLSCFRLNVPYHFGTYPPPIPHAALRSSGFLSRQTVPQAPASWDFDALFDAYQREIHTFYPVVRLDQARTETSQVHSIRLDNSSSSHGDTSSMKTCLLLAAGGCILQSNERQAYMTEALSLARDALGHLIGNVSFETIEVLFLFSICLRLNDEITASWTTFGICLSVAHSLGLDRPGRDRRKNAHSAIDAWNPAWWALYSYEKLFSFQLGYVSSISDETYDDLDLEVLKTTNPQPQHFVLSMAKAFSKMSHRCAKARLLEDRANRKTLEAAIKDKVNATGESFLMLSNWVNSLPAGLRPTSDFMRLPEDPTLSSFISLHYHNAILMLNRNALLISKDAIHKAVEVIAKGTPWEYTIRNGQSMVANSARKIIHLLADNDDTVSHLFAPSYFPLLHALYVLAVHILKQPQSRISKIDQSLLITAADLIRCYCVGLAEADRLSTVLNGLIRVVQEAVKPTTTLIEAEQNNHNSTSSACFPQQDGTNLAQQPNNMTFSQSLDPSDSSILNPVELSMDEGILDPFSGQPFNIHILPDEIGCDWADFENLLQRLENESVLYPTEEGMSIEL